MPRFPTLVVAMVAIGGCGDDGSSGSVVFDTQPAAASNDPDPVFAFHDTNGTTTGFFCTREAGERLPCSSPVTFEVAEGPHQFVVSTGVGSSDESAVVQWTTDLTVPETSISAGPPPIDNSQAESIAFSSSEADATFECALDGVSFVACTSPAALSLSQGDHVFAVRAIDPAGNVDPTPAELAWTLDSVGPDTVITNGPAEGATTSTNTTFEFASTSDVIGFECNIDSTGFGPCTSPQAVVQGNGNHTFRVRAVDTHGVADPSPATRSWIVDAVPPVVTIDSHPAAVANDSTPTFTFSSNDPEATFQCAIDSSNWQPCTSPFVGPPLAEGDHGFDVRAVDPFGNFSTEAVFFWRVDTLGPVINIDTDPVTTDLPSFQWAADESTSHANCFIDQSFELDCSNHTYTAPQHLSLGVHVFLVQATDLVGNLGTGSRTFTVPLQ